MTTADESTTPEDSTDPTSGKPAVPATESVTDPDPLPPVDDRSPEFVEEEAQRGDFVLRWAIVLLAFQLGFSQTDNSAALVHARAGQYMQSHGFLPPRVDVLSFSAADKPWIQLSWLFDHASGGLEAVVGPTGFTLLSALFAALAFGFAIHTTIAGVSTWWTVICGAFALMACYPRFTPTPELLTLAFLAITLHLFYRWQTRAAAQFPWQIPVVFVVWANMDPHMWLGLVLLGLYALGHSVDRMMGRNGWTMPGRTKQVWALFAACLVAAMVNPFGWESLLEPLRQYGTEYPTFRTYTNLRELTAPTAAESQLQYYGLLDPLVWMRLHKTTVAGAVLILVSITLFLVNLKNLDTGYLLSLLGFVVLSALATHELAATALLASVLAGLNGQDWYRQNFRTDYSTDTRQIVFSQGGRALTVVAVFGFAFLGVSGRLTGPEGVRIGTGLDPNLQTAIDGMRTDISDVAQDEHIFNFTLEQGDILVWLGYRSFVDSRVELFGRGDDDIVSQHGKTRLALRRRRTGYAGTEDPRVWQKTLQEFKIGWVAPRLYGRSPDYTTYFDLFASPQWTLTKLGSSTALFRPAKPGDVGAGVDFRELGLRTEVPDPPRRLDWARPPSFYDTYLFVPKRVYRAPTQLAHHYMRTTALLQRPGDLLGACYLAIRSVNESLAIDSNDYRAYQALGDACATLKNIEESVAAQFQGTFPKELRFRQAVAAYRQSLIANPNQPQLMTALAGIYMQEGQAELAVDMQSRALELMDTGEDVSEARASELEAAYRQRNQLRDQVLAAVERAEELRNQVREERTKELAASGEAENPAYQAEELFEYTSNIARRGLTLTAQRVLDEELDSVRAVPKLQSLYGNLLMQNGQLEDGSYLLQQLAELAKEQPQAVAGLDWHFGAASAAMIAGDYTAAREIWGREFAELKRTEQSPDYVNMRLTAFPLVAPPEGWPAGQTRSLMDLLVNLPEKRATVRFYMSLSLLEEGRPRPGAELMRQLINEAPSASVAGLTNFYYQAIADQQVGFEFDPGYIPLDMTAASTDRTAAPPDGSQPGQKPADQTTPPAAADKL